MEHTYSRSYKNPKCTSSYIGKKLIKKVKKQPNIKLKDIQKAVHEKYTLNISAGKARLGIRLENMLMGLIHNSTTSYGSTVRN